MFIITYYKIFRKDCNMKKKSTLVKVLFIGLIATKNISNRRNK